MNYIRANNEGVIEVISIEEMQDCTCQIQNLPDDFYKYIGDGKYLAYKNGLKIKQGWKDFNFKLIIPTSLVLKNKDLKKLIEYCDTNDISYEIEEIANKAMIYLEELYTDHKNLFDSINKDKGKIVIEIEER